MIHRISGLADQALHCGLRFGRAFHTILLVGCKECGVPGVRNED